MPDFYTQLSNQYKCKIYNCVLNSILFLLQLGKVNETHFYLTYYFTGG
jgi:hypothetical protein